MDSPTQGRRVAGEEIADGPPAKRRALEEGQELPCGSENTVPDVRRKTARNSESITEAGIPLHWQAVGRNRAQIIDGAIQEALSSNKPVNGRFWKSIHTKLSHAWSALVNGGPAVFEMNGSFNISVRRRFEVSHALLGEVLGFEALPMHVGKFVVDHPECSFTQLRQYHEAVVQEGSEHLSDVREDQTVAAPPVVESPLNGPIVDNVVSPTALSSGGNEADSDDEVLFVGTQRRVRRSGRNKVKREPTADTEESQSVAENGPTVKQEPGANDDSEFNLQLSPTPPPPMTDDDGNNQAAVESALMAGPAVPNGAADASLVAPAVVTVVTTLNGFQCFGVAKPCGCQSACLKVLHSSALGDFVFLYQNEVVIRNEHGLCFQAKLYQCKGCIEARAIYGSDEDVPSVFVVGGLFVHRDPIMPQGNEHRCIRGWQQA